MESAYSHYIMDQIFDFFQYPENYDRIMINAALDKLECSEGRMIFGNTEFYSHFQCNKDIVLGFFLANVPLMLDSENNMEYALTPKLEKLKKDTYDLINLGKFNELATLDLYLLLEMAMRCAYSKWLGRRIVISKYGMKDIVLNDYDYRRLKLYIRLNRLGRTNIDVNGEPFPGSENSLLNWATKFMDRPTSLMFRLSLNVRNLLAHGENEWDLYPVSRSVEIASSAAGKLLHEIQQGMKVNEKSNTFNHGSKNTGNKAHRVYRNGNRP